jgi:aminoglycoside phosphotransferase (APT) family kinase protein
MGVSFRLFSVGKWRKLRFQRSDCRVDDGGISRIARLPISKIGSTNPSWALDCSTCVLFLRVVHFRLENPFYGFGNYNSQLLIVDNSICPRMEDQDTFLELLRRDGVVHSPDARLTPLSGGVSCDIYLVDDGPDRFVVKRALEKLRVKADWFADIHRNQTEWQYIRYVSRFLPAAVPRLRQCSATDNYFAMQYFNGKFSNWKQMLIAGQAHPEHAAQAGDMLGQVHRHSTGDAEAMRLFDTTPTFFQLRIEAYLLAAAAKQPALRAQIEAEAARLAQARECLVHGDFTPKNILVGGDRMILLDCEVAWYGEPAFDVASLLNHFCLKALLRAPDEIGMHAMINHFWSAYQSARPSPEIEPRVGRLLLMLMLARVDGKSPVEYFNPEQQQFVREFVLRHLPLENFSVRYIADEWFNQMRRIRQ